MLAAHASPGKPVTAMEPWQAASSCPGAGRPGGVRAWGRQPRGALPPLSVNTESGSRYTSPGPVFPVAPIPVAFRQELTAFRLIYFGAKKPPKSQAVPPPFLLFLHNLCLHSNKSASGGSGSPAHQAPAAVGPGEPPALPHSRCSSTPAVVPGTGRWGSTFPRACRTGDRAQPRAEGWVLMYPARAAHKDKRATS